ncbi:hypothetical protein VN0007_12210 [Helicobacter pylori]
MKMLLTFLGTKSISNVNLIEQFNERLALYNNNNRMDTCVVRNTEKHAGWLLAIKPW